MSDYDRDEDDYSEDDYDPDSACLICGGDGEVENVGWAVRNREDIDRERSND